MTPTPGGVGAGKIEPFVLSDNLAVSTLHEYHKTTPKPRGNDAKYHKVNNSEKK